MWQSCLLINRERESPNPQGATTLVSVFLLLLFSTIGLSLIYLSQIHLKLSASKKNSTLLEYAAENGIKRGYVNLLELISQAPSPITLSPGQYYLLSEDCRKSGTKLIELALESDLPVLISDTWNDQSWKTKITSNRERMVEEESYFSATYSISIFSEGTLEKSREKKRATLVTSLRALAGQIPLSRFPLLIDKKLSSEEKANFSTKHNVSFLSPQNKILKPEISFSKKNLIPEEASSEIADALKIKLFYPQNLSSRQLRAALGLEESDEPIPNGVYLIKDDLGLGGIFIQGDVEEMVLAIKDGFQVISFLTDNGLWVLKYSPSKNQTYFISQGEVTVYDLSPREIIIIDGKVKSLGGGTVDNSGKATMVNDREIPSILKGTQLTIVSSDKITISSHLMYQGVKWQEGIPYVKDSDSQLFIFSTGKQLWDEEKTEGGISIDESSPDEIKIHATLTSGGNGFSIKGDHKNVNILGSLQTTEYSSQTNALAITPDNRYFEENITGSKIGPKTKNPVLLLQSFMPVAWEELN
jgi:hypothetical protein